MQKKIAKITAKSLQKQDNCQRHILDFKLKSGEIFLMKFC